MCDGEDGKVIQVNTISKDYSGGGGGGGGGCSGGGSGGGDGR